MEKCNKCQGTVKEVNVGFNHYVPAFVCMSCHTEQISTPVVETEKVASSGLTQPVKYEVITLPYGLTIAPAKKYVNVIRNHTDQVLLITLKDNYDKPMSYFMLPSGLLGFPADYMQVTEDLPQGVEVVFYDEG